MKKYCKTPSLGKLIVFSGMDCAGKTTQINTLRSYLIKKEKRHHVFWIRGGYTPGMECLKRLLRKIIGKTMPSPGPSAQRTRMLGKPWLRRVWLSLSLMDIAWQLGVRVRARLWLGSTVICDRFLLDTLIDFKLNFEEAEMDSHAGWRLLQWFSPRPNLSFLLLVPVEVALARSHQKNEPFADAPEVMAQRREQYLAAALTNRELLILDGTMPLDQVRRLVLAKFQRLSEPGKSTRNPDK